jgi:signal transduction histidine kinase
MPETSKLILSCSHDGTINIVEHRLGDWPHTTQLLNKSYLSLVAPAAISQAMSFWNQVQQFGAVLNRELSCTGDGQSRLFSGITLNTCVLLSITDFQPDMAEFLNEIMKINTAQHNTIRTLHQTSQTMPVSDPTLYEEISRINNELMNTERELHRVNQALNRKSELLELINKILRHDLMNIFSVLRSGLRLYSQDHDDSLLESISSRLHDGIQLINEMRAMDKLYRPTAVQYTSYSPQSIAAYLQKNYPQLSISVVGDAEITADSFVHSVFSNLASNALRHGKATEVILQCTNIDFATEVLFCDNGTGIPQELQYKIFELDFVYGATGHTGIGLYILSQIMQRYRGSVEVQDSPQGGACFRMIFPNHRIEN